MGYQELETTSSGNVLIAPTFLKVSESNKVSLAELKVAGYTPPEWKQSGKAWMNVGGCTGASFMIQTLTTSGRSEDSFVWLDYMTGAETKVGPGWFADANATPIEGGADMIILDPGKGLWVKGSGYSLIVPAPEL